MVNILFKLLLNSLMVMLVLVFESMVLIWWLIGWFILIFVLVMVDNLVCILVISFWWEWFFNLNGVLILFMLIFNVCLFSLVCFVLWVMVCILGIDISNFFVWCFILFDFVKEIFGNELILMVNEFLLKDGRKLCFNVKNIINVIVNSLFVKFNIVDL